MIESIYIYVADERYVPLYKAVADLVWPGLKVYVLWGKNIQPNELIIHADNTAVKVDAHIKFGVMDRAIQNMLPLFG